MPRGAAYAARLDKMCGFVISSDTVGSTYVSWALQLAAKMFCKVSYVFSNSKERCCSLAYVNLSLYDFLLHKRFWPWRRMQIERFEACKLLHPHDRDAIHASWASAERVERYWLAALCGNSMQVHWSPDDWDCTELLVCWLWASLDGTRQQVVSPLNGTPGFAKLETHPSCLNSS